MLLPFTVALSFWLLGIRPSRPVLGAIGIVCLGFVQGVYAQGSGLNLSTFGMFIGALSSLFSATHAIYVKRCLPLVNGSSSSYVIASLADALSDAHGVLQQPASSWDHHADRHPDRGRGDRGFARQRGQAVADIHHRRDSYCASSCSASLAERAGRLRIRVVHRRLCEIAILSRLTRRRHVDQSDVSNDAHDILGNARRDPDGPRRQSVRRRGHAVRPRGCLTRLTRAADACSASR